MKELKNLYKSNTGVLPDTINYSRWDYSKNYQLDILKEMSGISLNNNTAIKCTDDYNTDNDISAGNWLYSGVIGENSKNLAKDNQIKAPTSLYIFLLNGDTVGRIIPDIYLTERPRTEIISHIILISR